MRYVIIDSNALIHRAFHALPPLTSPDGSPSGAVYGFTSILLRILKDFKPDHVLAAFDTAAPTFRHIAFERYKAQREKAPDELYAQFPKTKKVLEAFGIPVLEKEGFEADDIIGTLAKKILERDKKAEVIIVTGDMDALQLVSKNVSVFTMRKGVSDTVMYDEKAVMERYEFPPSAVIDYKALRGDPSDNIPGVKGIGEKTATELLKKYKNLKTIYSLLEKGKLKETPSVCEKLKVSKEDAFMSQELATIHTNMDIEISKNILVRPQTSLTPEIQKTFDTFGFASLLKRLGGNSKEETRPVQEEKKDSETQILSLPLAPSKNSDAETPKIKKIKDLLPILSGGQLSLFFDETTKEIAIFDGKRTYRLDAGIFGSFDKKTAELFETKEKIIFNAKPFILHAGKKGVSLGKNFFDLKIASFLLNTGVRDLSLPRIITEHLGTLAGTGSEEWIRAFPELKKVLETKLKKEQLLEIFERFELPLIPILAHMERLGIKIDESHLKKTAHVFGEKVDRLTKEIYEEAGQKFNINSPQQLADVLFGKLKIGELGKKIRKTEGGKLSTDQEQLTDLKDFHSIIPKILEYREVAKLKTTYTDALPRLIAEDGRIHTTYEQAGTATGRLSSRDPNLQNIPVKTSLGKEIRRAFVAEKGFMLVSFDYSQLELRLAAEIAGDKKMAEAFARNLDIHALTAAEVNKVPLEKVTPEMRRAAKALNFGILYGMGVRAFAKNSGMNEGEAKKFFEEYFKNFSGIQYYMERTIAFAKEHGYVETYFGRRRNLSGIIGAGFRGEREAERMAINMPIQGTAADVVKLAMIEVARFLDQEHTDDVRMLLQIHDELLFEISEKKGVFEAASKEIKKLMEGVWPGTVRLRVDMKKGQNWADLE
ncbi:MAG: DNA polymerase I [Candidatus Sungbacteria bacterium RIFCSPLOWO2_02_FULL_47_9]|uniref:DNA polymerase I n=1 Tax=Candidatus Sungbacteria bacterium RIFCSPHIGHO2_01_FULL_47_32 TaxID=1802264 RepID=A0A1G2K431_9BACT|nr:MAG: polymerase protein [Parcubacteria group bacterium GW2011_GWA2_47_10]OGZ94166.1 MAG: DNA polymerase I [Candidatus Sungbacteria bacterium RIFCSPHIGHO2_01_FULL_47_32]OGZ98648.1 MAG: DNA polymerase I [Candidatus Sungbacteria bacterium RIFCSPHIGHO2_02_FULL_46_12]OHA06270.1 MAG: DNA polymerase I [Candidatus Sungbacteria bacterium RIFCSPLOWO2_01_FULL_47_32]OHA09769.1 MAG: DNA polymerase I [Candidatus Sungbacteria bacterium RIFCSPLOWO2_02_FULL_47_9]